MKRVAEISKIASRKNSGAMPSKDDIKKIISEDVSVMGGLSGFKPNFMTEADLPAPPATPMPATMPQSSPNMPSQPPAVTLPAGR